jgi:hypothetical protein
VNDVADGKQEGGSEPITGLKHRALCPMSKRNQLKTGQNTQFPLTPSSRLAIHANGASIGIPARKGPGNRFCRVVIAS